VHHGVHVTRGGVVVVGVHRRGENGVLERAVALEDVPDGVGGAREDDPVHVHEPNKSHKRRAFVSKNNPLVNGWMGLKVQLNVPLDAAPAPAPCRSAGYLRFAKKSRHSKVKLPRPNGGKSIPVP